MFHKGSNVAKKIDAWVQKELRDSQYRGCTVAYNENTVYNIYMRPRENKIDAKPLSGDSESGCRLGPNRRIQIQEVLQIQKFHEEHMIQCESTPGVLTALLSLLSSNCDTRISTCRGSASRSHRSPPSAPGGYSLSSLFRWIASCTSPIF